MEELIKKITEAAGISEEQAKKTIEVVSGYIKDRVPDSFKSQIDNLVKGGTLSEGVKASMNEMATDIREKAEDVMEDVRAKISDLFGKKEEGK